MSPGTHCHNIGLCIPLQNIPDCVYFNTSTAFVHNVNKKKKLSCSNLCSNTSVLVPFFYLFSFYLLYTK